jgi:hypothetical protein
MPVVRGAVPKVTSVLSGYGILLGACFERVAIVYPDGRYPVEADANAAWLCHAQLGVIDDLADAAAELRSLGAELGGFDPADDTDLGLFDTAGDNDPGAPGTTGDAVDRRGGGDYCPATEAYALARRCERLAGLLNQSPFPGSETGAVFGHLAECAVRLFATLSGSRGDLLLRRWPGLAWDPPDPPRDYF